MVSKVLVSGASGYLALHTVGQLLTDGYSVIGSVRSQAKADKLTKGFKAKHPNGDFEFVIVPDIAVPGAFDQVLQDHKDIKWVLHTASPFSFGLKGSFEDVYLKPALDGTLNFLKSIQKHAPQVEKVVVTSSMAAIQNLDKAGDQTFIHTEETWNPIEWKDVNDEMSAYIASKKLAEKAAWDYVASNPVNFKLNVVNPPYIYGPQYFDEDATLSTLNTSSNVIGDLLKTDPSDTHLFDENAHSATDVRDVAKIHVLALSPDINGERLYAVGGPWTLQGILNIINENFKEFNGKIAKGQPDKENTIVNPYVVDNSKTIALLGGYKFRSLKEQVVDTVAQLLKSSN